MQQQQQQQQQKKKQPSDLLVRLTALLSVLSLVAAIALNVVSLALPNWLALQVDRTRTNGTNFEHFTRNRGVFLTCLTDTAAAALQTAPYAAQVKFVSCLDNDLGNLDASKSGYIGAGGAWIILMLRRLHLGLHLASGFSLCLSLLAFVVCAARRALGKLHAAAGLSLLAAGLQFGAHVAFSVGLLRELLPPGEGTTAATAENVYNSWPSWLQFATHVTLGHSYYIALAAFVACVIAAGTCGACAAAAGCVGSGGGGNGGDIDQAFAPSGHAGKANGQPQLQLPMARLDNVSNLSGGVQSVQSGGGGRLPRIPVYQSYGPY